MQPIITYYQQNAQAAQQQADKFKSESNTYSFIRLAVFLGIGFFIFIGAMMNNATLIAITVPVLLIIFAVLVKKQSKCNQQHKYYSDLKQINDNEIASLQTRGNLYNNGAKFSDEKHFYTSDLDIFGNMSLFQLINRAATTSGSTKLGEWLSAPAGKPVILERQAAAQEIADKNQWKLEFQTLLLFANKTDGDTLKALFAFLKSPLNIPGEVALSKYIQIAPYLMLAAIIGSFFWPIAELAAIVLGIANLAIVSIKSAYIAKSSAIADKISKILSNYASVFEKIEKEDWQSAHNGNLALRIKQDQTSKNIALLARLIEKMSYNLNMLVGILLNIFFLWALKQTIAIEQWKRSNQQSMEDAFEVIADFEAIVSIGGLRFNYPDWTLPQIADGDAYTIIAQNITHPLISSTNRVNNNYELTNAFKIDIITGSNMAGKSTFLRTIGINTVLALCGAPVCADAMQVSIMTVVSYMRIKDSLNESTSTFKAELDRLQMLLKAVEHEYKVFFLIDEMLRGTNSVDKYLGSKAVIEQLIAKKGVGMVATHDLQIAQLEQKYPDYVRNFYFDIQVVDGEMLFDYKIKHGECKTFNASLLLKQIGIDIKTE
ncbi:DNA mismatch repair protein MutS [Mucilaginibacter ximonensis]|uniref:DNA mismatch repair protein MutS n=1 Tax=Mucilaginibacter ximonensis TaxID=538021 RepID=A0ABW5Y6M6_9SPHI